MPEKTTILILTANPKNTKPLRLDEEVREIRETLNGSSFRERFDVQERRAVRPKDIQQALLDVTPQIVQFSGHGVQDGLMIENNAGEAILASPDALGDLFKLFSGQVECVFLNACFSQPQAEAIAAHVTCIIGMSSAIGDQAACEFATGFYRGLGAGKSIPDAFEFGRNMLQFSHLSEASTPVLFSRRSPQADALPDAQNPTGEATAPPEIDLTGLPESAAQLFGRERELAALDEAWRDPATKIAVIVAWGGVGKTALVNRWLTLMQRDGYRGAQRVYGVSFYSRGAAEGKQASADLFFDAALRWFGDPQPEQGDAVAKAKRLAALIRKQKTLLILDGVEPLQHPPGDEAGRLKDQGVKVLLKDLATNDHAGLCVVSTRLWTTDLNAYERNTASPGQPCPDRAVRGTEEGAALRLELTHLEPADGAALLRSLGVKGSETELRQASTEFDGHALALTLLGTYLRAVCDGDARQRDTIARLIETEERQGKHARWVMASYSAWLAQSESGRRQLSLLRLMGLFDRPAIKPAIDALRQEPVIPGVTDALIHLSEQTWKIAVQALRDLRLLNRQDAQRPDALDCHPLIREYFGDTLRAEQPDAYREAHRRLYEFYKNLPEKQYPDTLEEMEPLFAAVAHGCQAGKHQEALVEVYWKRIKRKDEHYSTSKLGAFGADLAAVANFFETLWTTPAAGLSDNAKAGVLSWSGFRLRAVGRLREAAQPMQAGMEASIQQEDWKGAAQDAGNLGELYLTIGDVAQAVASARQSVEFADRSGDAFQREVMRATLADALHQSLPPFPSTSSGNAPARSLSLSKGTLSLSKGALENGFAEAERLFQEAETIQQEDQPGYPYLYSLQGFQYCDLLLSQGAYRAVLDRTEKTLEWAIKYLGLLDIALDRLSIGRAELLQALAEGTQDVTQAAASLHQAVEGLRKSGYHEFLAGGLLARAALFRQTQEFSRAWTDLEEVFEIAERGGMKLHLTDYHLEACRLCLAEGRPDAAQDHLVQAQALIRETGYHRRDPDAAELAAALNQSLASEGKTTGISHKQG